MAQQTFIIDCPSCKAKVLAIEEGSASRAYYNSEEESPEGIKLVLGRCPSCKELLVGQTHQIDFEGYQGAEKDRWSSAFVRIYPSPKKTFISRRIPQSALMSLSEADLSMQINANMAACVMFGRALEAVCRDVLGTNVMLAAGIKMLKDKGTIDDRLYDWSQQLRAFRNIAAHPDENESSISSQDVEDLQSFVYAIIEYVYDLADRYEEFKKRNA